MNVLQATLERACEISTFWLLEYSGSDSRSGPDDRYLVDHMIHTDMSTAAGQWALVEPLVQDLGGTCV